MDLLQPVSFILTLTTMFGFCRGVSKELLDEMLVASENGNIDGMFDKVGEALGELVDTIGTLDKSCKYKCENGNKPVPKKGHKPSTNGCGSYGFEFDTKELPQMTTCCDDHDRCYDTCNSDKEKCDNDFSKCLLQMCDSMEYGFSSEDYEGCKATSELIHTGTEMFGCKAFRSAQDGACDCGPGNKLPPAPPKPLKQPKKGKVTYINQDKKNKDEL